ncbi:MAG: hypothetical protein KC438_14610 [Thermomicrobiales bacterium]|nr:hypothetical protein [Thermomicrobiales bacterium]MCO5221059.1 hypothetical protein [Thermomicrobiales bacterium]
MIGKTRVGFKYFFWGMIVGVAFAPMSGKETRAKIVNKLKGFVDTLLAMI